MANDFVKVRKAAEDFIKKPNDLVWSPSAIGIMDAENWGLAFFLSRESTNIDRSNFKVALRDLKAIFPNDVKYVKLHHPELKFVRHLAIRAFNKDGTINPVFLKFIEIEAAIEEQGILDPEHYRTTQKTQAVEAIRSIASLPKEEAEGIFDWLCINNPDSLDPNENDLVCPTLEDIQEAKEDLAPDDYEDPDDEEEENEDDDEEEEEEEEEEGEEEEEEEPAEVEDDDGLTDRRYDPEGDR